MEKIIIKAKQLCLLLLMIIPLSCSKESLAGLIVSDDTTLDVSTILGISPSADNLTENDAKVVATLYMKSSRTKSVDLEAVTDVITIVDCNDLPAIYAVNYEDGYVLVSVSKSTCPILAVAEHGKYVPDSGTGRDVIINELVESVEYSRLEPAVYKSCWRPYEMPEFVKNPETKSIVNDDYYDLLETYLADWQREGRKIYYLRRQPDEMPDDIYELFCNMARDDMGEVKGYPYIDCAIITEKFFEYRDKTGPFMTTSWNQTYPFNSHLDLWYEPLGCVTIATGQIMKYHRWPAKYNWTLMPDGTSNDTLSAFLKELHDELGVENGYASITDAARVFNSYAYNCRRIVHSVSEVDKSIAMQLPVYMRGEDAKKQEGHAWVCDGKLTI